MFKSSMDILINVNWFKKVDFFLFLKLKIPIELNVLKMPKSVLVLVLSDNILVL